MPIGAPAAATPQLAPSVVGFPGAASGAFGTGRCTGTTTKVVPAMAMASAQPTARRLIFRIDPDPPELGAKKTQPEKQWGTGIGLLLGSLENLDSVTATDSCRLSLLNPRNCRHNVRFKCFGQPIEQSLYQGSLITPRNSLIRQVRLEAKGGAKASAPEWESGGQRGRKKHGALFGGSRTE